MVYSNTMGIRVIMVDNMSSDPNLTDTMTKRYMWSTVVHLNPMVPKTTS